MADRITRCRTVRLVLHVPIANAGLANWSLMAVDTKKGVPSGRLLHRGIVPLRGGSPTEAEVWEALDRIVGAHVLA